MKRLFSVFFAISVFFWGRGADPMATSYSYAECQGSLSPYPQRQVLSHPDTLKAVMINHVGRHGSRYPASAVHTLTLRKALQRADSARTITPLGKSLLQITDQIMSASEGRWGALDSLGEAEQRGIAWRMHSAYPELLHGARVHAISSYSPRAMMSMYAFTHQLDRLDNTIEFFTSTGRINSPLMRPFDIDPDYTDFRKSDAVGQVYQPYFQQVCPVGAIERVLGRDFPYAYGSEQHDLAIVEYYVLAGLSAMSLTCDMSKFFSLDEANALWSCFNLRQYLQRTATTLSTVPADIATTLLLDLLATTDDFIDGRSDACVQLRFGHAETLMPLLSLMRLPGCYYLTNYFDTVAQHWRDFYVVPMAANLQMVLFQSTSGRYYVRFDLNEVPVPLKAGSDELYTPWDEARDYLSRFVPLYAEPF